MADMPACHSREPRARAAALVAMMQAEDLELRSSVAGKPHLDILFDRLGTTGTTFRPGRSLPTQQGARDAAPNILPPTGRSLSPDRPGTERSARDVIVGRIRQGAAGQSRRPRWRINSANGRLSTEASGDSSPGWHPCGFGRDGSRELPHAARSATTASRTGKPAGVTRRRPSGVISTAPSWFKVASRRGSSPRPEIRA
jgi:hypothetical protein